MLIGSDSAPLHPRDATNEKGQLVETQGARLKISILTGKFLAHSHSAQGHGPPVTITNIDTDHESVNDSTCDDDLITTCEPAQQMEYSIPAQIVEAIVHSSMHQVDSPLSSSSRSSIIMDRPKNPHEINIITVNDDGGNFEDHLVSIAPQL